MHKKLYKSIIDELCPEGNWKLRCSIEKLLNAKINQLPCRDVTGEETRYPTDRASMKAFLETFFARHYFQVQKSLVEYLTSSEFYDSLTTKEFNILDIGSGPAVASLAVTEMLDCILGARNEAGIHKLRVNYVLNDTENICLGIGQELLRNYFRSQSPQRISCGHVFSMEKGFPSNFGQLERVARNLGLYDLIILSYVLKPLHNDLGLKNIANALSMLQGISKPNGRIMIIQDKFSKALVGNVSRLIGQSFKKETLAQHIYSENNDNETYTYSYYTCLFAPTGLSVNARAV